MPYKYYTSTSPVYPKSVKEQWIDAFQAFVDNDFTYATTIQTISEETAFASGSWANVDVRVNRAINTETGQKMGDDFKILLFKDLTHSVGLGRKYVFDSNTWLTVNTEFYRGVANSCLVRRCNATLRWVDSNGNAYSEPCAIDYALDRPRDVTGVKYPIIPQGYIDAFCQANSHTKTIHGNQRFLFGSASNRVAYEVFGNGLRSYLNDQTADDESVSLIQLTMGGTSINEDTDNLVTGYADYNQFAYVLTLSPSAISSQVGDTVQLVPSVTLNGNAVIKPVSYRTSASTVAGVSASGLVTMLASGSANVTGYMTSNLGVTDVVQVVVASASALSYEVRVSPNSNVLLQGDTQAYTVYLYRDGVVQADTFTFTLSSTPMPATSYTFTVLGGNSFSLQNILHYLDAPIVVHCVSGAYEKDVSIYLKGLW